MPRRLSIVFSLSLCLAPATWLGAEEADVPSQLEQVGIDQRLDEDIPLDLEFRDETGRPVALGEYFSGKPVIVNLVYYECPMLCTLVLNGLVSSLKTLPFDAGDEFDVVTVSIDPRETPELARAKKRTVLDAYGRDAENGWHFLTGEEEPIRRLAEAVGFRYSYDARSGQFAHAAGIMVATPEGKLARYFYGVEYAPRDLRLALVEASQGKIGSVVDQILLFCYHYDPATGRYSAAVMNFVRLGGVLTLIGIGALVFRMIRRDSRIVRREA